MGITQSSAYADSPARRGVGSRRFSAVLLGLASAFTFVGAPGCGDVGDENYVPDVGMPVNQADLSAAPYCVGTCEPDLGSQVVDCGADDGLEFFPVDVLNGDTNLVTGFYSYGDNTTEFLVSGPDRYQTTQANYEPPTVEVRDLCAPDSEEPGPNDVHHLRGGLFREWGGGMGRRLVNFVSTLGCPAGPALPTDPAYCPDADPRIEDAVAAGANPQLRTDFYGMIADLTGWEGISFWARQGPNNTAGIRVYVADRQLDDDIAFLEGGAGIEPMCGRARECSCRNHRPCTPGDGSLASQSFCYDPNEVPSIAALQAEYLARGEATLFEVRYPFCGASACDDQNDAFQAPDPLFSTPANAIPGTAECLPYKLTNDLEDLFCYDPNDPTKSPPDGPQRCGDGWARGVTLSRDWQFYKVPFTELRQEGYGKEFQYLDLSKITLVRFTWMQGWVDVWLDDVRFYKQAGAAPASQ